MNFASKTFAAGLILIAGAAIAADATNPVVNARQTTMDTIAMNAKVLGDMAGGKTAFDAAAAGAAKTALAAAAAEVPAKFEPQETDPKSKAKPEIWTNWDDFVKNAETLVAAAEGMDTSSVAGLQAGMEQVGATCGTCHKAYRN